MGVWMLVIPSVVIAGFQLYYSDLDVLIFGGSTMGGIILAGVIYGIYIRYWASDEVKREIAQLTS